MMTGSTVHPWNLWIESQSRPRRRRVGLVAGLAIGTLLGAALAAVAADRILETRPTAAAATVREWQNPELSREWREWRRTVPYQAMYRSRGLPERRSR